jgi:hypothetical protein
MNHMPSNDSLLSATANNLMLTVAAIEVAADHDPAAADLVNQQDGLAALLESMRPATDIGLVFKAAALLAIGPESMIPSHQERLAISLATDIVRLFGGKVLPIIKAAPEQGMAVS